MPDNTGGGQAAFYSLLKSIFKYILGTVISVGGLKGWLIKLVLTEFYDEVGEPIIKAGVRHAGYLYDKAEGKVLIRKLNEAELKHDKEKYNSITDRIFS